jgi:Ser/Thr protein kinase RdoA (MazF antagonist)
MRAANLLVEGDRLGVIDFDDCGLSWFAYDFAAAISFMEHEPFIPDLMAAWLEGYRRVAPLDAEHEAALPMFIMLRRMQLTAWIASHAETPTAQSMGTAYTDGTVALAERYLAEHS